MNVVEMILVYAGIPLAVFVVLALLTLAPGGRKRVRYKPGQPWEHPPVWYEPHPEHVGAGGHEPAHGAAAAVPGRSTAALGSSMYPEQAEERNTDTSEGSAGHGAGGHGAPTAHRPVNAGPLGGARGTW
ncbi:aa3-type cytochrome oxidase subunit CtaJ [Blastococcus deserti]|uniref:Secreted protein n=1 Tax=Blastococcus deserti TaxID=2259033 RepID=A0ABW4XD56_9ACTN